MGMGFMGDRQLWEDMRGSFVFRFDLRFENSRILRMDDFSVFGVFLCEMRDVFVVYVGVF